MLDWRSRIRLMFGVGVFFVVFSHSLLLAAENLLNIQTVLRLPRSIGLVTDAHITEDLRIPDFILIQDTHGNPQAQERIAALLIHGYRHWGIRKIFLEGASAPIDTDAYGNLPARTRDPLLQELILQGRCTGAIMAAAMLSDTEQQDPDGVPFQLIGSEDPQLYSQDLEMYEQVQAGQERALQALETVWQLHRELSIPPDNPLARQLERTERLIALEMTPELYQAYLKDRDLTPSLPALDPVIRAAETFYRLARLRSTTLLEGASRKLPAWEGPRVIIAGGFHTGDMLEALRREGKSFVVITPALLQEPGFPEIVSAVRR